MSQPFPQESRRDVIAVARQSEQSIAQQLEQENEILRRATAYSARDVLPR